MASGSGQAEGNTLRQVVDLPYFLDEVEEDWHADLMATARNLMKRPGPGLLRSSPEAVIAFRYHDVMKLTVERDAGNMPIELIAGRSKGRAPDGSLQRRAATIQGAPSSECWRTRLSRTIRRCTSSRAAC